MPQMCMQHTECPPFTVSSCASTYLSCILLLRPLEWWRIIVMSTSVCVSVCLCICLSVCLRTYLRSHKRDLCQISCACSLWPWLGPPPAGWRNTKKKGQFGGFFYPLTMHCNAFAANGIDREGVDGPECTTPAKCKLQLPCYKCHSVYPY